VDKTGASWTAPATGTLVMNALKQTSYDLIPSLLLIAEG
jgi:hypothetical protein